MILLLFTYQMSVYIQSEVLIVTVVPELDTVDLYNIAKNVYMYSFFFWLNNQIYPF